MQVRLHRASEGGGEIVKWGRGEQNGKESEQGGRWIRCGREAGLAAAAKFHPLPTFTGNSADCHI